MTSIFHLSIVLLIYTAFASLPAEARPRTGPDRPFTVDWQVAAPAAPHLHSVTFVATSMTAITVGEAGTILWTDDAGRSWAKAVTPPNMMHDLHAVFFTSDKVGIIAGDGGTVLRTENGGKVWREIVIPRGVSSNFAAVTFSDCDNGVVIGSGGTILWTDDGGKRWEPATMPPGIVSNLYAVALGGMATGIAVGEGGTILWTQNRGKTWEKAKAPPVLSGLGAVIFTGAATAVAAAKEDNRISILRDSEKTILWTDDGGKNWEWATTPSNLQTRVQALKLTDEMKVSAVGSGIEIVRAGNTTAGSAVRSIVLSSEDGGKSWNCVPIPPQSGLSDLRDETFVGLRESSG